MAPPSLVRRAYWRQQVGYGEGETWLDAHHPEKFVRGQMLWRGHIYSPLPFLKALSPRRVNTGTWGTAAFPSIYTENTYRLEYLPHSPAWMLVSTALVVAGFLDLVIATPDVRLLFLGITGWVITVTRCIQFAVASDLSDLPQVDGRSWFQSRIAYRALIGWMHRSTRSPGCGAASRACRRCRRPPMPSTSRAAPGGRRCLAWPTFSGR